VQHHPESRESLGAEPCVKHVHASKFDISQSVILIPSTKFAPPSVSGLAININHPLSTPFFVTIIYQYCHVHAADVAHVLPNQFANHITIFHFVGSAGNDDKSTCFFNISSILLAGTIAATQSHEHGYCPF
jgi:hypothetical protein